MEETIKSLHAILQVSITGYVYTYHKSFPDFMPDASRSLTVTCAQSSMNDIFARTCLETMITSLRFNICNLPSSFLLDDEVLNIQERIKKGILDVEALEYSSRYWMFHVRLWVSEETFGVQISACVNKKCLYWVEVMNLLKARSEC